MAVLAKAEQLIKSLGVLFPAARLKVPTFGGAANIVIPAQAGIQWFEYGHRPSPA